ncbi:archaetidylserine decarboxylase [Alicyclobacillus kakegawensis]|uniref:archaetidylserine decarboxylase n=1 Tax=Alicyclobacillus kakegawensis TaxID=392012 RepID=UPI00082B5DD2|nr:archaetidylserine decarboxylase [Alicyclobacillus kakegawensis]
MWKQWGVRLLPKRTLTAVIGRFARMRLSRLLIPHYVRWYQIDADEAEHPLDAYSSLCEFFTRGLLPGARPLAAGGLISPVDGTVSALGRILEGTLLQAKGYLYTVSALLGSDKDAEAFEGGHYITLYLSPRDYHRIHMPISGKVVFWRYIPGRLYPVNALGVAAVPGLFSKNERLVSWLETGYGRLAMVKVGATVVGSIRTPYGPRFSGAWNRQRRRISEGAAGLWLERGGELGRFELGSTVILLCPPGMVKNFTVSPGSSVRMGEQVAQMNPLP